MRGITALAMLGSILGACSDDTGILVEVHGEQLNQAVARLDTMVIVDDGTGTVPDSAAWGDADKQQATVSGIDLRTEPYSVMFRPDGVDDSAKVWVSALAYDGAGNVIGFGEMPGAIAFAPNAVKKVELDLQPAQKLAGGCIVNNGTVAVRPPGVDDCDGDQVTYDVDCDDLDARVGGDLDGDPVVCTGDCNQMDPVIYPGADEVCDGKDDDCDPVTQPAPSLCVQVTTDDVGNPTDCRVGEALCNDTHTGGGFGQCVTAPLELGTYDGLCRYWGQCNNTTDPASCFVQGHIDCDLGFHDTSLCLPATTNLIDLVGAGSVCSWELIGNIQQGPWNLGLVDPANPGPLSTFVDTCDATLVVQAADLVPRVFVLEADFGTEIDDFALTILPRRADCDPQQGSQMECTVGP